ncbi:MAG: excinuclease ABC subunit UvrC [Planctomycetota bacterium]
MSVEIDDRLRQKIDELPRQPGVYLMKDKRQEVIYVGKANDVRSRVRSYFQQSSEDWRLISRKIDQVADVDVVVTASEKEALLLENNFIKQFRPRYNVLFRDDKSFVSIKIDRTEPYPRPTVTRKLDREEADYFGPYASAKAARKMLRALLDMFPLRRCSIRKCRRRDRPCLYGEMGKCSAPCCSDVTEEEYDELIDEVEMFLRGKTDDLLERLREEMDEAAERQKFEKAARIRDRIEAVEQATEKQRVASSEEKADRDIFGLCTLDKYVSVAVLMVRGGNIQDVASYRFPARIDSERAIFRSFLNQFYSQNRFIPDEILVPVPTPDAELLEDWLSEKKGRKVRVTHPQRGHKRAMTELANRNARQAERAATTRRERRRLEMESLREILDLSLTPENIECFDISTLQGREAVGSMVVFRDGEPDKSSYRHYKIREVEGQDDFAMMREVLRRRYRKVAEGEAELPELVLVDGGKGQLGVAVDVLEDFGLEDRCDAAALAKARSRGGRQVRVERVFLPGRPEAIEVPEDSYGFRLITRVRDEAHRFAITYHRKVRRKSSMRSPLVEVPGIGQKKARRIMEHFGGLNKVRRATREELKAVPGISDALAEAVVRHFQPQEED